MQRRAELTGDFGNFFMQVQPGFLRKRKPTVNATPDSRLLTRPGQPVIDSQ